VSEHFGVRGYWVRALLETGDDPPVQLRTLLPNTTFATQTITLRNEAIGSSDASANQVFTTARSPVLAGAQLEVRETGEWVGWREVADFLGSTAQDRHFVLDRVSGQVSFGDGVQGRIPLRGAGNIRMARYQTGGGSAGNRAAGTIVQLKTTVPYIEKASNVEPAEGGVDAESNADLIARAPRTLRHGGRAVALQDYEDLALAASPEVARAKSVPLRHLQDDPLGNTAVPGAISLIIVPRSTDAKPLPSAGLMTLVEDNLRALSTPTASLSVVGPLYVRVDVSIEVALASLEGASVVEQAVLDVLRQFLHPLTGGRDGTGWDFGRQPQLSDLHAAVSDVRGVDHIRALILDQVEEPQGALGTARFLVYSGQHQITLTYVGAE
jgi:predicted phage baseplate assembly protein